MQLLKPVPHVSRVARFVAPASCAVAAVSRMLVGSSTAAFLRTSTVELFAAMGW